MHQSLNGKKVFITGADGFIGSHLVEKLIQCGASVRALVYYNSWNQSGWLEDCDKDILDSVEIINGDIRDSFFIEDAIRGSNIIFHLSSLIGIPYSYKAAKSYIDTNIHGALNIAQASLKLDTLDSLLHVSTSEVYGSAQSLPMDENHPLVGQSPYSASKIGADKIIQSYYLSFGLPCAIARPFNTYGPRQTSRAVIPTIINQALNTNSIKLGNTTARRDFNFVTDTVDGMIALAICREALGEEVNIGSGENWSIQEIINFVSEVCSKELEVIHEDDRVRPEKSEVNELLCDNTKIMKLTNWKPQTNIKSGLKKTVEWIEKNKSRFDDSAYSI
tara:strand:+ start:4767 stop:5765 length:999 start_codon:yes stop_codon:yes gene_type:complete